MRIAQTELDLLAACICEEDDFASKLTQWESGANLDTLSSGAVRLLPFLFKRMKALGVETKLSDRVTGVFRYFWAKREVQAYEMTANLPELISRTSPVALKGLALEELAYLPGEMRPFDDLDFLVSRPEYFGISQLAKDKGWLVASPAPETVYNYLRAAKPFRMNSLEIDLHWTLFPVGTDPEYDLRVIERSHRPAVESLWHVPSPTDCLLHTIIHGHRNNEISPIRWLLDAYLLIQRQEIDWDLFWQESGQNSLGAEVESGLNAYRKATVDVPNRLPGTPHKHVAFRIQSLQHLAAKQSYKSRSIWLKRLMRLFGSDFPLVAKALWQDQGAYTTLQQGKVVFRESWVELRTLLRSKPLIDVISGGWSKSNRI